MPIAPLGVLASKPPCRRSSPAEKLADGYCEAPPPPTNVQPARMVWPVPQAQIDLNPSLTQNPGY